MRTTLRKTLRRALPIIIFLAILFIAVLLFSKPLPGYASFNASEVSVEHHYPGIANPVQRTSTNLKSTNNLLEEFVPSQQDETRGTGFAMRRYETVDHDLDYIVVRYQRFPIEIRYYDGVYDGDDDNLIGVHSGYGEQGDLLSSFLLDAQGLAAKFGGDYSGLAPSIKTTSLDPATPIELGDTHDTLVVYAEMLPAGNLTLTRYFYAEGYSHYNSNDMDDLFDYLNESSTPTPPYYAAFFASDTKNISMPGGTSFYSELSQVEYDGAVYFLMRSYPQALTLQGTPYTFTAGVTDTMELFYIKENDGQLQQKMGDLSRFDEKDVTLTYLCGEGNDLRLLENYELNQKDYPGYTLEYHYRLAGTTSIPVLHYYTGEDDYDLVTSESYMPGVGNRLYSDWPQTTFEEEEYEIKQIVVSRTQSELVTIKHLVYGSRFELNSVGYDEAEDTNYSPAIEYIYAEPGDTLNADDYERYKDQRLTIYHDATANPADISSSKTLLVTPGASNTLRLLYYMENIRRAGGVSLASTTNWSDAYGRNWTDTIVYDRDDSSKNDPNYDNYVFNDSRNVVKIFYEKRGSSANGSLSFSKRVTGTGADTDKAFDFTLTLGAAGNYSYVITGGAGGNGQVANGGTISLKHGQSVTISGIPGGTNYAVAEASYANYALSHSGDALSGAIAASGTKTIAFTNSYLAAGTGALSIEKRVTGTGGEQNRAFTFTVILGGDQNAGYNYTVSGSNTVYTIKSGETLQLRHGQTAVITGLAAGTTYTVAETPVSGYTVSSTGGTGSIQDGAVSYAVFTNTRNQRPIDPVPTTPPSHPGFDHQPATNDGSHALMAMLLLFGAGLILLHIRRGKAQ